MFWKKILSNKLDLFQETCTYYNKFRRYLIVAIMVPGYSRGVYSDDSLVDNISVAATTKFKDKTNYFEILS